MCANEFHYPTRKKYLSFLHNFSLKLLSLKIYNFFSLNVQIVITNWDKLPYEGLHFQNLLIYYLKCLFNLLLLYESKKYYTYYLLVFWYNPFPHIIFLSSVLSTFATRDYEIQLFQHEDEPRAWITELLAAGLFRKIRHRPTRLINFVRINFALSRRNFVSFYSAYKRMVTPVSVPPSAFFFFFILFCSFFSRTISPAVRKFCFIHPDFNILPLIKSFLIEKRELLTSTMRHYRH